MIRLAEIQEAIRQLDPKEQQVLRHWLDETAEETPEMLATILLRWKRPFNPAPNQPEIFTTDRTDFHGYELVGASRQL